MVKQRISQGSIVYPNVIFEGKCRIDAGVILGFSEDKNSTSETKIGKNSIFRAYTIVYSRVSIGKNFQSGPNVLIRENNHIGNEVAIWHGATISPDNFIGDGCRIHAGSFLELVKLGKRVFIGPNVVFTDDPHPSNPSPRIHFGGAIVDDEAVICANVTILPHIKIGKRSIIGAGSVVTKDIPPYEVWVGNPAKFLKKVGDIECRIDGKLHLPYQEIWK